MNSLNINLPYPSSARKAPFDLVAIVASAGGLEAILQIVKTLPADFPAAIAILQHLSPNFPSLMTEILSSRTGLQVKQAKEGDRICPATLYTACPNYHLLVNPNATFSLTQTSRVNYVRPSADILFDSVATSFKKRAIAVVLTGKGHDGGEGIKKIKKLGGTVIVQNQATAEHYGMPETAILTGIADYVLPLAEISATLIQLVMPEAGV